MVVKFDGTITLGHVLTFIGFAAGGVGAFISISGQLIALDAMVTGQSLQIAAQAQQIDGTTALVRSNQILITQTQVLLGVLAADGTDYETRIRALENWQRVLNAPP